MKDSAESIQLSELINIKHGYAFKGEHIVSDNNNVVLVTPGNFKIGGGFQENKCKYFDGEFPLEYVLKAGDLIVTMTDLSKQVDTLGYSVLVPDNLERTYLHNQRIGLVQFKDGNNELKDYIYWYLRSYDYHRRIVGSASGSTVKHTSPGRILEQRLFLPQEQDKEKVHILKGINETISKNDVEKAKLKAIVDVILPKLMSGELDFSDANL